MSSVPTGAWCGRLVLPRGGRRRPVGRNTCWGRKPRFSAESLPIAGAELGRVVELPTLRSDTSRPFEKPSNGRIDVKVIGGGCTTTKTTQ